MAKVENTFGEHLIEPKPETLNLLSTLSRVETPFVKVQIGEYVFGVYDEINKKMSKNINAIYPNYIQSLTIKKINGKVNTYTLVLRYPITENVDPNYFEKVFSSVSKSRKIIFSYGDLSLPSYCYRNEEAIISSIGSDVDISSPCITYTISAISSCAKTNAGAFTFRERVAKPSDVIKELLYNKKYGLQELFYGMANKDLVEANNLILSDDKAVNISLKSNISILDYLSYLVSCMTAISDTTSSIIKDNIYSIVFVDDVTGTFPGPYFKIVKIGRNDEQEKLETYTIDIGFPSQNIVLSFRINENNNYTILYDYNQTLTDQYYVERINDEGKLVSQFAPILTSANDKYKTTDADRTWWTNVTNYPISASISVKGLLRPATLMTYVRLNVLFFGRKHSSSGLYIITQQIDTVDMSGYKTELNLTRVSGDTEI